MMCDLRKISQRTKEHFKAILELIEKCETLEELRKSVKRIMREEK